MCVRLCTRSARRGLTLVEVTAAIALLATLLVAILSAFRAHNAQIRNAERRLKATAFADSLLMTWSAKRELPQPKVTTTVDESAGLGWRLIARDSQNSPWVGTAVLRLEILDISRERRGETLASVELLAELAPVRGAAR